MGFCFTAWSSECVWHKMTSWVFSHKGRRFRKEKWRLIQVNKYNKLRTLYNNSNNNKFKFIGWIKYIYQILPKYINKLRYQAAVYDTEAGIAEITKVQSLPVGESVRDECVFKSLSYYSQYPAPHNVMSLTRLEAIKTRPIVLRAFARWRCNVPSACTDRLGGNATWIWYCTPSTIRR